jgi:hypothetical protein
VWPVPVLELPAEVQEKVHVQCRLELPGQGGQGRLVHTSASTSGKEVQGRRWCIAQCCAS